MTEQEYLIAWAIYGVAALLLLLVTFKATGWLWRFLREPLRLVAAVLLFTPTIADAEHNLYAPAIAISVLDLVFKVGNSAWSAVADLAVVGTLALVAYLIYAIGRWFYWRSRPKPVAVAADELPEEPVPTPESIQPPPVLERNVRRDRVEPRL